MAELLVQVQQVLKCEAHVAAKVAGDSDADFLNKQLFFQGLPEGTENCGCQQGAA